MINLLEKYIDQADGIIALGDEDEALEFVDIITHAYINEYPEIYQCLQENPYQNVEILKIRLTNYKSKLIKDQLNQEAERQHKHELDLEELKNKTEIQKKSQINFFNNPAAYSQSYSQAITTVNISQTINNINKLPDGVLNKEESINLKELIHSIDEMIAAKDKGGAKSKISKVLSTIGNKGFDLFVAVAPYLIQAATTVQSTT